MSSTADSSFVKSIRVLHIALVAGTALVAIVTALTQKINTKVLYTDEQLPFLIVAVAVIVINPIIAFNRFSAQSAIARDTLLFESKLELYRTAFIQKAALLEGAAILNFIVTMVTGSPITYIFGIVATIVLFLQRPSLFSIVEQLNLTHEQKSKLEYSSSNL